VRTLFGIIIATVLFCGSAIESHAQYPGYYQNRWYPRSSGGRITSYYSNYYYTPTQYHVCYYYPDRGRRYVYYYNWERRSYWGRFDTETSKYSLLAESDRKENLADIPEKAFPEPVALNKVKIPGTDLEMIAPPKLPD
jgi:hypothetical protein